VRANFIASVSKQGNTRFMLYTSPLTAAIPSRFEELLAPIRVRFRNRQMSGAKQETALRAGTSRLIC